MKVIRAEKTQKEEVYKYVKKGEMEEEKNYLHSNFNLFYKPIVKTNRDMIYETLENHKYQNRYFYYFAYEQGKVLGFLSFVHVKRNEKNELRVINFFLEKQQLLVADALLNTLEEYAKKESVKVIKMRTVFPTESALIEALEKHHFQIQKVSYTIEDLQVEKKLKPFGYKISFLEEQEKEEIEEYYKQKKKTDAKLLLESMKNKSSVILVARRSKKIVGLLCGTIVSPYYTLAYLDEIIANTEKIEHDLLNEFKRVCLKQDCDDVLLETGNENLQVFALKEHFIECRRAYLK